MLACSVCWLIEDAPFCEGDTCPICEDGVLEEYEGETEEQGVLRFVEVITGWD